MPPPMASSPLSASQQRRTYSLSAPNGDSRSPSRSNQQPLVNHSSSPRGPAAYPGNYQPRQNHYSSYALQSNKWRRGDSYRPENDSSPPRGPAYSSNYQSRPSHYYSRALQSDKRRRDDSARPENRRPRQDEDERRSRSPRSGDAPRDYRESRQTLSASPQNASRSSPTRGQTPLDTVVPGAILNFPGVYNTFDATKKSSRLLQLQPWVNSNAANHPTLVWKTYESDGETIACCLQITSFDGNTIETKYPDGRGNAWRYHSQYVPIAHQGTISRANMPILQLEDGEMMGKQSYVHLDHYFEIEARLLWRLVPKKHLASDSLAVVVSLLRQFVQGDIWRQPRGPHEKVRSPLDFRAQNKLHGERLALTIPKVNAEVDLWQQGEQLERQRTREEGTMITGTEPTQPAPRRGGPINARPNGR